MGKIDRCRLCEKFPWYEKTCRAVEYCHRQLTMFDAAARDEKSKDRIYKCECGELFKDC